MALALLGGCASAGQSGETSAFAGRPLDEILGQSPASDWRAIEAENTIYIELAAGRVIIELAPDFAPKHAAKIRALARAN
jgi:peptidylprolyl isomerase